VNGQVVTSYGFNAPIVDGGIGLLTKDGNSSFDNFMLRTNDPAFGTTIGGEGEVAAFVGRQFMGVADPLDVNGDGFITPMDVLIVINAVNRDGLLATTHDVNGDGVLTPFDALVIVNVLNRIDQSASGDPSDDLGSELDVSDAGESAPGASGGPSDVDLAETLSILAADVAKKRDGTEPLEIDGQRSVDEYFSGLHLAYPE
jgi:hypothetical protein